MATTFYQEAESPLHRLNPITKLVAVLVVVVTVFVPSQWWVSAAVLAGVVAPAAVASRVGGRVIGISLRLLLPLFIALILVQGLFFPEGRSILVEFGPARVTVEGLMFALGIALRITVLVTSFLILLLTTHPGQLMTALSQRGVPPKIIYIISSTLQIVPAFRDRAEAILLAQRARGLSTRGSLFHRTKVLLPLVTPLVLGLFTDVEERSTAMEARAFGSTRRRTSLSDVPDSTTERFARWSMAALGAAAVTVSILWGL